MDWLRKLKPWIIIVEWSVQEQYLLKEKKNTNLKHKENSKTFFSYLFTQNYLKLLCRPEKIQNPLLH